MIIDRVATILVEICLVIAGGALSAYLLREIWLSWRARRLGSRMELMRSFLDAADPDARAFAVVRRRPSTWRDLEALEHLLEERRAQLGPEATPEQLRELFAACDQLGIVDRYIRKLQRSRGWAERAFAARYLGEIGSARAVTPLIEVMRNTREEDREVRMAAGRALGRIRDPRAIEPLIEALAAPESWLPARVAEVLLQFGDATFDALVGMLGRHEDSGARPWAAQILGDLGNPRAVPPLLGCLTDLNDQVRARAASSLGRLGDRRAVPELIRIMLGDPVPYVRIQVVRALGTLGDPRSLHHLIDALKDGEWWVRIRVVEALEQLGDQAVEPLFLALEDGDNEVRQRAAMTLERLGVLDTLVARLAEVDAGAREKLLAAGQSGVVEILIGALEHEDPRVRYMIAEILGEVRNTAVEVALIGRLEAESDPRIRSAVVRSLAQLQAASGAQPISRLLGDADERIRVEAVRALERIHVADPHVLLAGACRDPEPRVRAGAAVVLGKVGDAQAVPQLLGLLSDADATVRVEAARAVGLLHAEEAVPRLMESFHDTDPQVQAASARALGQIGSPACLEVLARGLENADAELGAAIAWAVGQIRWDDPEKLIDVLFQGNDRSSRLGVLAALGKLGNAAGRELIRTMLHDDDNEVVIEAIAKLGELEDADALPALHGLLASPVEATRLATIEALRSIGQAASLPVLRQAVLDPSPEVRARAVLCLAYLRDVESGDLLRGVLAAERSTPAMRAHALLGLMAFGREQDLGPILEMLQSFPLYDFLHERSRLDDPILHAAVERLREAASVEYMVASIQSRAELEAALVQELATTHERERRVRVIRTLGCLGGESAYPSVWRTFYKDPCEEVRVAALQFLATAAPAEEFFRLLIDALDDLQPRVRAEALRRLQDVPVEKALPLVLTHLGSPEPELQAVLVDYLAGLADPALDQFLDGVLGSELDVVSRSILVRVLGRVRHRDAAPLLEAFLEESDPGVRRAAIESLAHVPGQKAAALVSGCLEDPDVRVRLSAVDAALALGTTEGLPLLRRALEDPVAEVRRTAILRLSRLAPRAALEDFTVASRDAEPRVRAAAIAALAIEGSQPIEEWIGAADVPVLAAAIRDMGSAEDLERRLASARPVDVRLGALRALFLRDARLRAQALAAARLDPSPRIQAVGRRLEEILGAWIADARTAVYLADVPLPEPASDVVANAHTPEVPRAPAGSAAGRTSTSRPEEV